MCIHIIRIVEFTPHRKALQISSIIIMEEKKKSRSYMDTSPGTSRLMRTLQEVEKTKKRCNNAYRKKAEYVKSRSPIHE